MLSPAEKKWRLARAYAARQPLWCAWQVTYRCNYRCTFCGYWKDPMADRPEPGVAEFVHGARQLARAGSMMISLAGGEPFLREDLPEIVAALAEYHFPFLTTNGSGVTARVAREVMDAGLWGVSVSLDYADPRRHDRKRGVKGAWRQAVRAVGEFIAARRHPWQRVNVMAVLMEDNLDEVEALLELAGRLGAYFMLQPYCELKTGSKRHRPKQAVAERLLDLHARHANFLSNRVFLSRFDEALDGGVAGCRAGRSFFNIDSTGDVAICVERRAAPVGNVLRDPFPLLLERLRRAAARNRCRRCWYNCRGEIEVLYRPAGLVRSLPTLLFDRGKPEGIADC